MKIRNRSNLFFTLIILFLFVIILFMGFGIIDFRNQDAPVAPAPGDAGEQEFEYQHSEPGLIESPEASGENFDEEELENINVYDCFNEAVVNITTEVFGYNWFLEAVPRKGSSGSGSVIDSRGYILTNDHVVENAYKVNVTLADGSLYEGEVIGTDPENDLAVVKINPEDKKLTTISFGDSAELKVGQKVLAIGNPFAFERTLTTGIISGLGRPLKNDQGIVIRDLIQTDASINPGNSGGPLLNTRGELIGVNTMIYSPSGGSVGIGFAVPVDTARRVVPDMIQYGFVQRGWIDIEPVQLFPSLVRYAGLKVSRGILVSRVKENGFAEAAGIRGGDTEKAVRSGNTVIYLGGDIITEINGEHITSLSDFYAALERSRPGDVVTVTVIRGRKEITMDLTLTTRTGGED
jgi:S1-C subfamily serine protease